MEIIQKIQFETPLALWLLGIIPLLAFYFFSTRKKDQAVLLIPAVAPVLHKKDWVQRLRPVLNIIKLAAITCLIIGLARPRVVNFAQSSDSNKGVDILMAVDVSPSMGDPLIGTLDAKIDVLRKVATTFAKERLVDRIGLVEYAGQAYTRVPLTTDRRMLISAIQSINSNDFDEKYRYTAIGSGLGTAVRHIKNSKAKSRIIILLTDGKETEGTTFSPIEAAAIAEHYKIKVYTIGLGNQGEIDEELLREIAQKTGGFYYHANSESTLKNVYQEINKMEKTAIDDIKYYAYTELFRTFLLTAFVLLAVEILLRLTIFKSFI